MEGGFGWEDGELLAKVGGQVMTKVGRVALLVLGDEEVGNGVGVGAGDGHKQPIGVLADACEFLLDFDEDEGVHGERGVGHVECGRPVGHASKAKEVVRFVPPRCGK
ncbi:MAG TPA: hypothetical protein VF707_08635 [Ardenticatenaceae bacterium]|jgi:hypothetical protein